MRHSSMVVYHFIFKISCLTIFLTMVRTSKRIFFAYVKKMNSKDIANAVELVNF